MSGAGAVQRVLIIGPLAAGWTRAAQEMLRAASFSVTRLSDVDLIGMLLAAGGVRAVLVDARLLVPSLRIRIARLHAADLGFPVVVIDAKEEAAGDDDPDWPLRISWPAERERLLQLIGEQSRDPGISPRSRTSS